MAKKTPLFPKDLGAFLLSLNIPQKFEEYKQHTKKEGEWSNLEIAKKYLERLNEAKNEDDLESIIDTIDRNANSVLQSTLEKEGRARKNEKILLYDTILDGIKELYVVFFEKDRTTAVFRKMVNKIIKNATEEDVKKLEKYLRGDKTHLDRHRNEINSLSKTKKDKFIKNIQKFDNNYILRVLKLLNLDFESEVELDIDDITDTNVLGHYFFLQNRGVGTKTLAKKLLPTINGKDTHQYIMVDSKNTLKLNDLVLQMLRNPNEDSIFNDILKYFPKSYKMRVSDASPNLYFPSEKIKELIPEFKNIKSNDIKQYRDIFVNALQSSKTDEEKKTRINIFKIIEPSNLSRKEIKEFRRNFDYSNENIDSILETKFSLDDTNTKVILEEVIGNLLSESNIEDTMDLLGKYQNENFGEGGYDTTRVIVNLVLILRKYYDNIDEAFDNALEKNDADSHKKLEQVLESNSIKFVQDLKEGVKDKINDIKNNKKDYSFMYEGGVSFMNTYLTYLKGGWAE